MDWDQPQRWQIGPADISEVEMTDMQRFSLDKPLLLWLWPSPQSSLVLSAWKKLYFCFSYAKSLWNWAAGFFTFFYPGRINLFSPHQNVSLWISEAETFQIWAFSFSFWLWRQMKNFAIYKKHIYILSASKAINFSSLCTMSLRPHCACRSTLGRCHQLRCFHIPSGGPVDHHGSWCGIPAQHAQEER